MPEITLPEGELHPGDVVTTSGFLVSGLSWTLIQLGPGNRALEPEQGEHYILRILPKGTKTTLEDNHELLRQAYEIARKIERGSYQKEARRCRLALNLGLATAQNYFHIHIYAVQEGVHAMRLLDPIVRP